MYVIGKATLWIRRNHLVILENENIYAKITSECNVLLFTLQVVNDGFTLKPQSFGGFGYMWAGCRANYGVSDGKVAFQMKVSGVILLSLCHPLVLLSRLQMDGWS